MTTHNQTMIEEDENVIDLVELAKYLLHRWFYLFLATAIAAMIAFVYTLQFITPMYSSSAMLYVNNGGISLGDASVSISGGDLTASRNLVDTYVVILKNRQTLEEVIEKANLPYSYTKLNKMISASAVNNTEIMQITVTSTDPLEAAQIANTVMEVLPNRITQIIDGCSVELVSGAIPMTTPISPSVSRNTVLGALVGFVLCAGLFVVMYLLDTQIHSDDYLLTTYPDIPVLTVVPDMDSLDDSGYGYGSSGKKQ